MIGLEYPLLFGWEKQEYVDGHSWSNWPFLSRDEADRHFSHWLETLVRWKQVAQPPRISQHGSERAAEVAGFRIRRINRPIRLEIPLHVDDYLNLARPFWRRDWWDGEPAHGWYGISSQQHHAVVGINLWAKFSDEIIPKFGGVHGGRVTLSLNAANAVIPDLCYFRTQDSECMIEGDYFQGVPDLIAEVYSPASRLLDGIHRKEVYRRARVPMLWLLDPYGRTVEVHVLRGVTYDLDHVYQAGQAFSIEIFPEVSFEVDKLLDTAWQDRAELVSPEEPPPMPSWIVPRERRIGLEHALFLGHPDRRPEIWNNRTQCILAFGSPDEASCRFRQLLEEACSWERAEPVEPKLIDAARAQAEVGRFQFGLSGRHVQVGVAVDGKIYRSLLHIWAKKEAWDWGEDELDESRPAGTDDD